MDKLTRRGHQLFSDFDAQFVLLDKSNNKRIRKLSAIGSSRSYEMGCDGFDGQDQELPSKRFKLPTKFLDDCNGLHLASVPRKLRSAMKKRHRQSTSPSLSNSRKLTSAIESVNCDGVKKSCLKQGHTSMSPRETVSVPITKDEEEVAQTLYALAGLVFPENEANGKTKVESESSDVNAEGLPESKNSPGPAVEVGDIKLDPVLPSRAGGTTSPSFVESSAKATVQVDLLNKPNTQYQPDLPESGKLCLDLDNKFPQNQINIFSLSAKVELCNESLFGNAVNFRDPSELSLDSRLTQTVQQQTPVLGRKPEIAVELGTNIGRQIEKHDTLQESRKKGSGLWPGLSLNVSPISRSGTSLLQSPAATMSPWMDAALVSSKPSVQNGSSFAKVTKVVNGRRACKKCAAHVYISHLIQSLKSSESKDELMQQPSQMRPHGSRQGGFLGINTYTNIKSGFHEVVPGSSIGNPTAEKVPNEAKTSNLRHKKLHLYQPLSTSASGAHTSPKQIFDFLSLSAGGSSSEHIDSYSRGTYRMEPSSQAQVPYLHSSLQHHNLIPFSLTQSRYNSSGSLDGTSVSQQQGQLLPSYGNPFCISQAKSTTALTKQPTQQQQLQLQQQQQQLHLQQQQHQQQQQQQQQRLWAAQLAAQYRPAGTLAALTPSPAWQNIKQETCSLIQCGQALLSSSSSPLELIGPKYAPLSQHQQQLMAVTSFPPGRVKRPDHHLPSVYEEAVGGYRAASALPLQLLCNERL